MEEARTGSSRVNRRRLGMNSEKDAAEYLKERGLILLDSNFRCSFGEIDLIMRDGSYIVFVEVKYRSDEAKGFPSEAVNPRKMRTIRFVAREWLYMHRYSGETPCRFDVVCILGRNLRWIKNAFL